MYTRRGRARVAPPPAPPAGSPPPPARPPRLGAGVPRSGGVGIVELVQLRDQLLDPRRIRPGVDPVDRRHPLALEQLRHLLVGEDHQPLDQPVRLGLGDAAGADHVAARVEAELGLEGLDVEAGRAAPLAQRRGRLAGDRQRLGDRLRRFGPTGEDDVELVVVEPRVGADAAAVEGGGAGPPVRVRARSPPSPPAARPPAPGCRPPRSARAAASARPRPARRCCWPRRRASRSSGEPGGTWAATSAMWIQSRDRRRPRAGPRPRRRSRARSRGRR